MLAACWLILLSACYAVVAVDAAEPEKNEKIEQQRAALRAMAEETLTRLYELQPSAQQAISKSAGYAVFSNFGMKILFMGGGSGKGLALARGTGKETFMKMVEVQAGFGKGIKKFRLVWVFMDTQDLDQFIDKGWQFSGQGTVAARVEGEGEALAGAVAVTPGVFLYQLTDDGLAMELTAKGTKYFKDDSLN
jgi:lipid-binding SYLF domain-containing protein